MLYQSILVALYGRNDEKKLIEEAVRVAEECKAELSFIHVNDTHAGKMSMMMDALKEVTDAEIRSMLAESGFEELSKTAKILMQTSDNAAKAIASITKDFDLLIIGHHNKNSFIKNLTDSTDEMTSNLVSCPVLIITI